MRNFRFRNLGPITADTMVTDADRAISELAAYAPKLLLVLTAAKVSDDPSGNESLAMGESIDNRIVRELNGVAVEPLTLYAGKMSGYINEVLSYRGPLQLRAAERNPFNAYQKLFGLSDITPEVAQKLAAQRASVNDLVREQMTALMSRKDLSKSDFGKLDLHFQSIRDLELTMTCKLPPDIVAGMEAIAPEAGANDNVEAVTKMQMDIIALAIACGVVRAATLQIGDGNDSTEYTIDGVHQKSYHKISHRIDSDGSEGPPIEGAMDLHHKIDHIHGKLFKYLLDKLSAYEFANGTLLDDGVSVWTNDLADKYHSYNDIPYVIAGSANGILKTGQYIDAGGVANNKIFNTIGTALGCKNESGGPLDNFGDPSLEPGLISAMMV